MHEMSIVLGIVKIAQQEAEKANISEFSAIDIEIGTLAGVEWDALEFVWEPGVKGSVIENAEKRIHKIQGVAKCSDCESEFEINHFYDSCPNCGSFLKLVLKGKELRVKSLDV